MTQKEIYEGTSSPYHRECRIKELEEVVAELSDTCEYVLAVISEMLDCEECALWDHQVLHLQKIETKLLKLKGEYKNEISD